MLRDRKQLSQDGIIIVVVTLDKETGLVVAGPDIVSRGFVYVREAEALFGKEAKKKKFAKLRKNARLLRLRNGLLLKARWSGYLGANFCSSEHDDRPMILPIIMEIVINPACRVFFFFVLG